MQAKDLETHYNINLNYSLGNSHWRLLNHNQSWMQLFPHIQVKINSIVAKIVTFTKYFLATLKFNFDFTSVDKERGQGLNILREGLNEK